MRQATGLYQEPFVKVVKDKKGIRTISSRHLSISFNLRVLSLRGVSQLALVSFGCAGSPHASSHNEKWSLSYIVLEYS